MTALPTLTVPRPTDVDRDAVLALIAGDPVHASDRAAIIDAIRASVRDDGTTDANAWRPLIPVWVYPRVVGAVVSALVKADVLAPTGAWDWSTDSRGRNLGKPVASYRWVEPTAVAA